MFDGGSEGNESDTSRGVRAVGDCVREGFATAAKSCLGSRFPAVGNIKFLNQGTRSGWV